MTDLGDEQLRDIVQKQLARIEAELKDLEEFKNDLPEEEYTDMKRSMELSLQQTQATLHSMEGGSLLGQPRTTISSRQLGRDATTSLREEIRALERQFRDNALTNLAYTDAKVSLLQQLSSVGQLTESEKSFLSSHTKTPRLVEASGSQSGVSEKLLQAAAKQT